MDNDESFLTPYADLPNLEAQWNKLSVSTGIELQCERLCCHCGPWYRARTGGLARLEIYARANHLPSRSSAIEEYYTEEQELSSE